MDPLSLYYLTVEWHDEEQAYQGRVQALGTATMALGKTPGAAARASWTAAKTALAGNRRPPRAELRPLKARFNDYNTSLAVHHALKDVARSTGQTVPELVLDILADAPVWGRSAPAPNAPFPDRLVVWWDEAEGCYRGCVPLIENCSVWEKTPAKAADAVCAAAARLVRASRREGYPMPERDGTPHARTSGGRVRLGLDEDTWRQLTMLAAIEGVSFSRYIDQRVCVALGQRLADE